MEEEEEEEEEGEGHREEEMEREDGVGGQRAESQEAASPAEMRRGAEIHHRRRENAEVKEGEREERAGR